MSRSDSNQARGNDDFRRRLHVEGRVLAAAATARRAPTFDELGASLSGLSRSELSAAVDDLVRRGLVAEDRSPSPVAPLFDPPIVRYRAVSPSRGLPFTTTSKAGA